MEYTVSLHQLQRQLKTKCVTAAALSKSHLGPALLSTSVSLCSLKSCIDDAREDLTVLHAVIPQLMTVTAKKVVRAMEEGLQGWGCGGGGAVSVELWEEIKEDLKELQGHLHQYTLNQAVTLI